MSNLMKVDTCKVMYCGLIFGTNLVSNKATFVLAGNLL